MKISKAILVLFVFFVFSSQLEARIDKEKLSLNISKAEEASQHKLKDLSGSREQMCLLRVR